MTSPRLRWSPDGAPGRRWPFVAIGAGAVILILAGVSLIAGTPPPCGDLAKGYQPIIAFELARSAADLAAIFGDAPGACRTAMVDALDTANVVDVALFIPAYGLFLVAAFLTLRPVHPRAARIGAVLAAVTALADVAENVCLFALTPDLDASSGWMTALAWTTGVKWLGLAAVGVTGAIVLAARPHLAARIGAALCLLAPLTTVAAVLAPTRFGAYASAGVTASWLVFLAAAVAAARRPR